MGDALYMAFIVTFVGLGALLSITRKQSESVGGVIRFGQCQ
jgi:hypothetical protein